MYWIGFILALSSGLFSTGLVRSFIRKYYSDIKDSTFDKTLVILLIVGLSITTIKYYIDQNEIETLGRDVLLSKYQEISLYSAIGNKSGKVNGVNMVRTPINDWNKKYAHYEDGHVIFTCDPGAKEACREVIDKMPTYPFAYYFLAKCLKEENDNSWVEMAEKAKDILEFTTQIVGHKTDHDDVLREVNNLLK
jgi:hypothetical protein